MGAPKQFAVNRLMGSLQMLFMLMMPFLALAQQQQPGNGAQPNNDPLGDGRSISLTWQRIIAGFILLVVGILLTFRGFRHYRFTMFLAGFITGYAGWNHRQIIYVFGCLGGGLLVGAVCWLFHRFAVWILGGVAGLAVALYILAWRNQGLIRSKGGRIGLLVGAPVLGLLIGLFFGRRILIPATAIVGAYLSVVGIDLFARTGFTESIKRFFTTNSTVDYRLTTNLYIMLGVIGGLILLGMLIQTLAWKRRQRLLISQGRTVHDYDNDWTLFGRRHRAVRPDPTYPDGGYSTSGNAGYDPNNTTTATTTHMNDGLYNDPVYTEKKSWNPFKKNKKFTTTAANSDYPDNHVSYSSNAALNQ
ncbi:hypothetical protein EDD11_004627 [Mortierella claussenii]|nr:hypothetical protein EDD11_004627 [Mortierella claussenii]